MHPSMDIVEFGSLTAAQRSELEGDERDPFDTRGITLQYRPKGLHVGLREDLGQLVASAGLLVVEVEVDRERFPVVGIGGVIVTAQQRGRGLGRQVMEAALAKARSVGPAFALLFCHDDRAGLYRKLGFAEVSGEVVVQQPVGCAPMPQRTMWRPLRRNARWPAGNVVVHSLPF